MKERIYQSFSINELEELSEEYWDSLKDLNLINRELEFRRTSRATRLHYKVKLRIEELQLEESTEHPCPDDEDKQLFEKVGLHPNAPIFLIKAARKAYRAYYHPDIYYGHSEAVRKAAEEKFKEFDNVFDEIDFKINNE